MMTKFCSYSLFAFLLLLLSACSGGDSENVTFVVITGEPPNEQLSSESLVGQPAATTPPPATVLPTLAPSATPDIDPQVALQVADRNLLDGRYELAVSGYQGIINQPDAPAETRAAAAYGMGQAALKEGLFGQAVEAFNYLIQQFPDDFRAAQGYFLRGDAYLGLSQWEAAIADFQQYLTLRPGWIDSYAHERIGDAQLALDQYDAAFTSYTQAAQSNRSLVPGLVLREKLARLYSLRGDVAEAVAQYDAILEVAQNAPYRASIEMLAAQALMDAGEQQAGLARMRRIFEQYPTQAEAYPAMTTLMENGVSLDSYQQGRVAYFAGFYEEAVEFFNTYTTEVTLDQIPAQFYLLLGRAYREIGNPDAALIAFQTIIENYTADPAFGEALLEQGRTRFLAGDNLAAIERYLQIAETYDYLPETASEALWRAGYLYSTNGSPTESRRVFERLATTYPNSEWTTSGLFIAASAAVAAGETLVAESLYTQLAQTTTDDDRASAYLQVGQLALERGDQDAATEALNLAAGAAPDTYYSARAQDILIGREPFAPPGQFVFSFDDLAEVTAAEDWIRSTFGVTQEGPLWPLSPELEADPRVIRGRELWAVGAYDAAETEFFDVLRAYQGDGLASYQLAIMLRIVGAYYPSQVGAANLINAAGLGTLQAPAYIARMRYPAYYRDVVLDIGERYNLDPLLILSLIRHESLFDANATAAAGEKGLTQVIPSTGDYIAGELEWPDYQHSDLFRPYASVEFGAYYLSEQMQRFNGNTYAALAGYNAGPGRAQDWLALSGGDPDRFMAAITIDSVQLYIQLVYKNYSIYRELYGV